VSLCRSKLWPARWLQAAPIPLANGDAEATLEVVLAVVEESPEGQRERQRQQFLFKRRPNDPVTVNCACRREKVEELLLKRTLFGLKFLNE